MIDNRSSKITVNKDGFLVVNGVKIARYLPEVRALEFLESRSGRHRGEQRRTVVVKLVELAGIRG